MTQKKFFIIAGEPSGDIHGACLMGEIKKITPNAIFFGIGGDEMIKQGLIPIMHNKDMAVVGLFEILQHIKPIYFAYTRTIKFLREHKPDLLILIDYPGFNIKIGMIAKKLGIKVLYYIAPQVWAWKEGRIKKLRNFVHKMAVILPFEEEYFRDKGIDCSYVGNPLVKGIKKFSETDRINFLYENGINDDTSLVISLLPGSRKGEIMKIFPLLMETAQEIQKSINDVIFLVPIAPNLDEEILLSAYSTKEIPFVNIKFIKNNTHLAIYSSNLAILASGTVSLETCLLGTPQIVTYKLSPLTSYLAKKLIKVPYVSLVNLIAKKTVVPEFLLEKANPQDISQEAKSILNSPEKIKDIKRGYAEVISMLGNKNSSVEVAKITCEIA